ncbi:DUF6707 family protein [Capnocytophaga canimorsus]|uniref:DUF6707 family protein n=1 Tax=Capnocytophaga canimorsus TaxID=28188 RepID=UPI00385DF238
MKNILEKIESKFENQKPYAFVIEATKVNLESPCFLRKLCKSAYIAHLQGNIEFCEEILSLIIDISFTGNYDIWTWVESSIGLKMFISLENNQRDVYDRLKKIIYDQFEYTDLPESTRRINLKVFKRRMTGSSLQTIRGKINKYNHEKDFQFEFMYLIGYYSDLILIYAMNEGNIEEHIKNELDFTKKRILEIINHYKSNP